MSSLNVSVATGIVYLKCCTSLGGFTLRTFIPKSILLFSSLLILFVFISTSWADNNGWNQSRRYMTHGICNSEQSRVCWGGGSCDNGDKLTQCSNCSEIGGGWYQYNYYCQAQTCNLHYPKCDPQQTGFKVGIMKSCSAICATYVAGSHSTCSNISGQYCTNIDCQLACECGICETMPQMKAKKKAH